MTEYWKSKPKYRCQYCDIFITDDKPSRIQHETGLRHQGNKEKYIKGLYRKGAQDAKDKIELQKQLAAIGAAATSSLGSADLVGGLSGPVASTSGSSSSAAAPAAKPRTKRWTGGMSNYSSAAQLGLVNDETAAWDAELETGGGRPPRANDAAPGQWEVVQRPTRPVAAVAQAGGDDDEEDALPTFKSFKRERVAELDDEDLYDPGAIHIKRSRNGEPVVKRESMTPILGGSDAVVDDEPAGPRLKLPAMRFGTRYEAAPVETAEDTGDDPSASDATPPDPSLSAAAPPLVADEADVPPPPPAPSMFKKRKGGNSASRRVQT